GPIPPSRTPMTSSAPALRDAPQHSQQRPETVRSALRNPRRLKTEVLGGLVVALALIPAAISCSIIACVPPPLGLLLSSPMAVPLVIAPVSREHGMDYLVATVILAGLLQIVLALLGVAKLMRFIPRSVMTGFVSALAILIFVAQLPHLFGQDIPWIVYPLVAA